MSTKPSIGVSLLYSFPFLILVDTLTAPTTAEIIAKGHRVRFYPPFRSGVANFIPMPAIKPRQIPFPPGIAEKFPAEAELRNLAVIPKLGLTTEGKASLLLQSGTEWTDPPLVFPMDSLRIDVFGGERDRAEDLGDEVVSQFMQLLRRNSRQWWIEHVSNPGNLRGTFQVDLHGAPLDQPILRARGGTVLGDELPVNNELWQLTIDELRQGIVAPLYELLVLDARYFAVTSDLRRSVLDSAIACEQARDVHFERLWKSKTGGLPYKRGRVITSNHLPEHLTGDLLRLTNNARSYEAEHSKEFINIKHLWDSRGNVAHGGSAQYTDAGNLVIVNQTKAMEFARTAAHCVSWLKDL